MSTLNGPYEKTMDQSSCTTNDQQSEQRKNTPSSMDFRWSYQRIKRPTELSTETSYSAQEIAAKIRQQRPTGAARDQLLRKVYSATTIHT